MNRTIGYAIALSMVLSNCACSTSSQPQTTEPTEPAGTAEWSFEVGHANIPEGDVRIKVNDGDEQAGSYLAIHHRSAGGTSWPACFAIYSSGYFRLAPVTDKATSFGTSIVLGPSYWSAYRYFHNPKLDSVRVEGSLQDSEVLEITATGRLGAMDVEYRIRLHRPSDQATTCDVTETGKWVDETVLDSSKKVTHQAFKIVQFSSMYLDGTYHDANFARYIGRDGYVAADLTNPDALVFTDPLPMREPWLEVAHTDKEGWQGATPSVCVTLRGNSFAPEFTPQGWVAATNNQNDDNVGIWLNWDKAPMRFVVGDKVEGSFTVTASADPHAIPDG